MTSFARDGLWRESDKFTPIQRLRQDSGLGLGRQEAGLKKSGHQGPVWKESWKDLRMECGRKETLEEAETRTSEGS